MASIRVRLTATYAAALIATMAAFAGALWIGRGASTYRELQRYVSSTADIALRTIRQAQFIGEPAVVIGDSLVGATLAPRLANSLEVFPDYLVVLDSTGRSLYLSAAARQLDVSELAHLTSSARQLMGSRIAALTVVNGEEILIAAQRNPDHTSAVDMVVAGASTSPTVVSRRELLGTILAVAPLVLLVSVGAAAVIAGRALRPVESLINEVEAITDGRSLHRRLPVDDTGDELARLGATLNAMISRLETSFGALRRFTADASHELKTPLTVLRADVERAMTAGLPGGEQLVALEEALHEITRMSDLVNSLLTLARADEGRFDLHREPVDLLELTRDVYETALILGEDAGLDVTMPSAEPATVMGDAPRLRQLCLNLVTNAIKYTPRGGKVELLLERRADLVTLAVRDTGIGIAAADVPYIFDRFWRADRARSRASERGGFGLGLAISQYIAQAHGGSLTVQSRLTRGSTFTLTLPVEGAE